MGPHRGVLEEAAGHLAHLLGAVDSELDKNDRSKPDGERTTLEEIAIDGRGSAAVPDRTLIGRPANRIANYMHQSRRTVLAAAGTLLSAGCLRMAGSGNGGGKGEGNEDAPRLDASEYPPGVSEDRVSEELAFEHERNLLGLNYHHDIQWDSMNRSETFEFAVDGPRVRSFETVSFGGHSDSGRELSRYSTDEFDTSVTRIKKAGRTYYSVAPTAGPRVDPSLFGHFYDHLRGGDYHPTGTASHGGVPVFKLAATTVSDHRVISKYTHHDTVAQYDGRLLTTKAGTIVGAAITVAYEGAREDERDEVIETELTDMGSTTVEEPAWTDAAAERAPRFDAAFERDRTVVRLEHIGGDGVPVPVSVSAHEGGSGSNVGTRIESGFEPGGVVYLGRKPGERDLTAFDERPDSTEQLEKYLRVGLWAGVELYETLLEG